MKISRTGKKKPLLTKALLIMKMTTVIMLVFALHVSARGFGQKKLNLQFKKTEIASILTTIEKASNYRFLYDNNLKGVRLKVTVNFKDADLKQVLDEMFANTGLSYQFMQNNLIVIKEQDAADASPQTLITGKIIGDNNVPLSGVSVQVKGTNKGTVTNEQGIYNINVNSSDILVFSYVGYETQEIPVGSKPEINVTLALSKEELNQVVVIGYGVANKRDLTGSIVKVDGKEVADKPNTNPIASLQSKVAGLSVVNNGTPGQAPDIRIRGTVSIGAVHPLYVVDGILEDNIDYINPNDIESIEILKDPSSLAIFGVRGATGAIVITTKKAKAGQTDINFNTTYGFKNLVDKIQVVNASQFSTLFAEENANNGVATPDYSALTANTDWISAVTRTAPFSTNNLSISSSSEKNRFNLGLGYIDDNGLILHEELKKMLLSLSDEFKLSKGIKIGVNLNVSRTNNPYNATSILDDARKVMPQVSAGTKQFRIQDPYGTDSITANLYSGLDVALQNSGVINPLLELQNNWDKTIGVEYREVGSIYAEINFLKNFTFRSTFYADVSTVNTRSYSPLYDAYNPLNNTPYLYNQSTSLSESDQTYRKFQQDEILTYMKRFGDHSLTVTAGFTTYYFGNFNRYGLAKQAIGPSAIPIPNDPRFWYITNGFADPTNSFATSSQYENATVSGLARALYNYKSKYFLNASFRDDGSSQIPTKNRYQQFWAVGAAWDISKEEFMRNQNIFDLLKLKGSVGVLGNQTASYLDGTPIPYPFYPNLNTGVNAVFGNNIYAAATPAYTPNPDLKWETENAQEIGVEAAAFKNRLHFEANYYNKTTNNLMTYVSRAALGVPDELINGGSLRNWGEEFSASWNQDLSKDLTLSVAGNITFLQNKVLSLSADVPKGVLDVTSQNNGEAISETEAGMPIGYFKGYIVAGVFQSYADILKSPSQASLGNTRPGDLKYVDVNHDGKIDASDRTFIGNPSPKFMYGTSVNLSFKGFNLSVDIGGVYGNQIFRTWGALESPFQRVNYASYQLDRWHGPGTSNWVPILSEADRSNYVGSTYSIENGSYLRIRNVQLGYNFPKKVIAGIKGKNLRLFVNVQNIKTFKNNSGYTAEYGGSATQFGYDNGGGAIPVVTTFGLNVTF